MKQMWIWLIYLIHLIKNIRTNLETSLRINPKLQKKGEFSSHNYKLKNLKRLVKDEPISKNLDTISKLHKDTPLSKLRKISKSPNSHPLNTLMQHQEKKETKENPLHKLEKLTNKRKHIVNRLKKLT